MRQSAFFQITFLLQNTFTWGSVQRTCLKTLNSCSLMVLYIISEGTNCLVIYLLGQNSVRAKKTVLDEYLYLAQAECAFLTGTIQQQKLNPVLCTLSHVAAFCNKKISGHHPHLCTYKTSCTVSKMQRYTR